MNTGINKKLLDVLVGKIGKEIEIAKINGSNYIFQTIKHYYLDKFKVEVGDKRPLYSSEISKIFRARADGKIRESISRKAKARAERIIRQRQIEESKQFELEELIRAGKVVPSLKREELKKLDRIIAEKKDT